LYTKNPHQKLINHKLKSSLKINPYKQHYTWGGARPVALPDRQAGARRDRATLNFSLPARMTLFGWGSFFFSRKRKNNENG
jgi:hypothetical protein